MLRVILVDDERLARQGMRRMLAQHDDVAIVGEAGRVAAAADLVREETPDAVFLDIHMPGANGFDLLRQCDPAPKVVFVTAHSQHAVEAFAVQAVDYLLKPVHPERLAAAVGRLRALCSKKDETERYAPSDRICLRTPQRTLVAAVTDLAAIEAEGDFVRFHVADQPPLLVCRSLGSCEKSLPSPPFVRLSRSLLVNLSRVARIDQPSRDHGRLALHGTQRVFELGRLPLARLKKFA